MLQSLSLPEANPAVTEFLETRRSNLAKTMRGPGPDHAELKSILTTAARVPDHRKLSPWRFVVVEGEAREKFGSAIGKSFALREPEASPDRIQKEAEKPLRAPIVVAVVSSPKACRKNTPEWEQHLSVGAVCLKMCMAAQARGFAAQWLTEWYAYDDAVLRHLGLREGERIAGYIYLGSTDAASKPRARPDINEIISYA